MESITRNVREIASDERRVYEAAVGHALQENQQVVIQVVTLPESHSQDPSGKSAKSTSEATAKLPDWCNVYDGLTDDEIAEVEQVVLK
ncbi:MAG: hypothetical protein U9N87_14890 [Planctomycetota bacterium]|nr:hypothetical protein [Planctomycetota bacterium]